MAGSPEPAQIRHFTDVPAGAYYEKAVAWCTEQGLVGGYGNNLFGPDDAITREQLAVFLFNFANYKKFDTSARADLSGYKDADKISAWALEAVRWANAEGILNGNSDNTLTPQGHATRAQVASMISLAVRHGWTMYHRPGITLRFGPLLPCQYQQRAL